MNIGQNAVVKGIDIYGHCKIQNLNLNKLTNICFTLILFFLVALILLFFKCFKCIWCYRDINKFFKFRIYSIIFYFFIFCFIFVVVILMVEMNSVLL